MPSRIIAADYSNIEGRVLAWLAGEQWKLQAFRDFDAGTGPDLYKLAYSRSFGVPIGDVTKFMRLIGKVQELALGFGGGVGAFMSMAKNYGVKIGESYDMLVGISPEHAEQAHKAFGERGKGSGLSEATWVAAEIVKLGWRAPHVATVQFWRDMEDAAIAAVETPGAEIACGKIRFKRAGSFLFMRLPSGRKLAYPSPSIKVKTTPWGSEKMQLHYWGVDSYTRRYGLQHSYGGKLAENATQAAARDILVSGMLNVEAAGYPVVLHVHDEAVCEAPIGHGSLAEFEALMCKLPAWAAGLPVAAEGFEGERYRK